MRSMLFEQDAPFQSRLDFIHERQSILPCLIERVSYFFVMRMQTKLDCVVIGRYDGGWFPIFDLDHQDAKPGADHDKIGIAMPNLNVVVDDDVIGECRKNFKESFFPRSCLHW